MKRSCQWLMLIGSALLARAAAPGDSVVVIYNASIPASKSVADHYVQARQVPANQVFGFELPGNEEISRTDYREKLEKPLLRKLEASGLFLLRPESKPAEPAVVRSSIRYAAICFGVPVRILEETGYAEADAEKLRPELRRNEASVDTELALLPMGPNGFPRFGPFRNPFFGATNAARFHPTNGILLVARLDGPTAEVAAGLVDKALQAEADGLWGRAYIDARGLTNSNYKLGDDWMLGAAQVTRRMGFETVLDTNASTFSAGFPLSHVGFYAGWYDANVSGPFALPEVEFMPGAFAYHLHSFSARSVRSTNQFWVGPLLAKGATATFGSVNEPYLEGTPDVPVFLSRLIYFGFSFGEAAYAAQNTLSWQATVVGDPLYRPFGRPPQEQHALLEGRGSKLIEWSHLRVVNLNLATELPTQTVIEYIRQLPELKRSALLQEKLADLYLDLARFPSAIQYYQGALAAGPSRQQKVRIVQTLARVLDLYDEDKDAYVLLQEFLKEFPAYPEPAWVYERLIRLAGSLGKTDEAEEWKRRLGSVQK